MLARLMSFSRHSWQALFRADQEEHAEVRRHHVWSQEVKSQPEPSR